MFKMAKGSAIKSRSQAINQLKAVLVSADPALRESLTGLSNPRAPSDVLTCSRRLDRFSALLNLIAFHTADAISSFKLERQAG